MRPSHVPNPGLLIQLKDLAQLGLVSDKPMSTDKILISFLIYIFIRTQMCETGPSSRKPALFQKSSSVDSEIVRRRGGAEGEDGRLERR